MKSVAILVSADARGDAGGALQVGSALASKQEEVKRLTGGKIKNKGPTEKEQIDVQGNIAYDIVEFITETLVRCITI
ncbi:hypothetical protein ZIOFF_036743 [Zingiber officinale]|uniref:Uncharacterized protein n=1 Tax=Zingiber officinale TaxID=94328 RepID=A0A8J5GEW7_ZINOF|nr:hypothetical protein ZIOFF_036743 [Zingiber officinale]